MQTRRDLAKQETRAALAEAAIDILREEGLPALSADSIAQRAGVSRRTFFNYFPTTDAVLAVPSVDFMQAALAEFEARPADEPLVQTLTAALTAAGPELLGRFAVVVQCCSDDPTAERVEREVWDEAQEDVARALRTRLPADAPDLQVDVLAACVLATGRAAILAWVASLPPGHASAPARPDHSAQLRDNLLAAFGYLEQGLTAALHRQPER